MGTKGAIKVAVCQFPVGKSINRNANYITRQITQAKRRGAEMVHFPECALAGYGGTDFKTWKSFKWDLLQQRTREICAQAKAKGLWVILGSVHRLTPPHLPHNSLYIINPKGRILDRYDKRFCTPGDLDYYSPGDHFVTFMVNGVKCGLLICYDLRFPEIYRAYRKLGVQCMFHSFYNAHAKGRTVHFDIMRQTVQGHAGINYMWVSMNNPSGYYQGWPSVMIQPDGKICGQLAQHCAGLMVQTVNTRRQYYDASGPFRNRAMQGILHSGKLVKDARSRDRKSL